MAKVWIDQDLCTGDGLCEEVCPSVFVMKDDGLAYVKDGENVLEQPGGEGSKAPIPDGEMDAVLDAAGDCPGECIFVENED